MTLMRDVVRCALPMIILIGGLPSDLDLLSWFVVLVVSTTIRVLRLPHYVVCRIRLS
jgi:hypothetical protein